MDSVLIDIDEWGNLKYLNVFAKKITLKTPPKGKVWNCKRSQLTASDIIRVPSPLTIKGAEIVRWTAPYIADADVCLKGLVSLDFKNCKEVFLTSGNEDLNYDWDKKGTFHNDVLRAMNWQRN